MTRRQLLHLGFLSGAGLSLPSLLATEARSKSANSKAKSIILLFLSGGPSQLDTFDMKPGAPEEIRGSFAPIATRVPGLQICEHLPQIADHADQLTILRGVNHGTGSHPAGAYWMMTGMPIGRATPQSVAMSREDRPHPGSIVSKFLGAKQAGLPAFAMVPEAISPVGPERPGQHAGFLGSHFDPYRVNSDPNLPDYNPGALVQQQEISVRRLADRKHLLAQINQQVKQLDKASATQSIDPYFARAFDLLSSTAAQKAFNIDAESALTRERYGRHTFGQSVLLARRLVEAGVRVVQVNWVRHDNGKGLQGYDSHRNHLEWCKDELFPPTDHAIGSLLKDLADRGLLEETLIAVMGEFGRTPKFNTSGGRDHWSNCFSVLLAGGGLRGGMVYGASDATAAYPVSGAVTPQEITATFYHQLGLDPETLIQDHLGRPFSLVEGKPISAILRA
jgi:hypothetical protein